MIPDPSELLRRPGTAPRALIFFVVLCLWTPCYRLMYLTLDPLLVALFGKVVEFWEAELSRGGSESLETSMLGVYLST